MVAATMIPVESSSPPQVKTAADVRTDIHHVPLLVRLGRSGSARLGGAEKEDSEKKNCSR